jgi:hypothetical protein
MTSWNVISQHVPSQTTFTETKWHVLKSVLANSENITSELDDINVIDTEQLPKKRGEYGKISMLLC